MWLQLRRLPRHGSFHGALLGLVMLIAGNVPASGQRQRVEPPEPSLSPWIGAQTERDLQSAIDRYRRIVAGGGWPQLPDRIVLRPGDSDSNVALLRRRLGLSGELPEGGGRSGTFDKALEDGVKRFQLQHGLEPTGVVYGITQRSLNVPAETRLKQLQQNLARIQELTPKLATSSRYILMNAAGFGLQAIDNGHVAIASRTIAGKRATPTPVVSSTVQAINILPYWHVPGTIAKAALIPTIRKDPTYLYREHIRVFSAFGGEEVDPTSVNWWGPESERFVFRQDPGPYNALGVLRFDMPNKHIVYMHDTPMKKLFGDFERAYSAGCIRVQNFFGLAEWVIAGQDGWSLDKLSAAVASGRPITVKLARPVPVHFIYLTAWVENGVVQFRNDLYNRDDSEIEGSEDATSRQLAVSIAP